MFTFRTEFVGNQFCHCNFEGSLQLPVRSSLAISYRERSGNRVLSSPEGSESERAGRPSLEPSLSPRLPQLRKVRRADPHCDSS